MATHQELRPKTNVVGYCPPFKFRNQTCARLNKVKQSLCVLFPNMFRCNCSHFSSGIRTSQSGGVSFFFRVSSYQIANSVCWSHALVNGPTSKRPASDGGLCSGQLLMIWSAVCAGSPHSHAALSASPHFFMDAPYRPTPVRSLFRVVRVFGSYLQLQLKGVS